MATSTGDEFGRGPPSLLCISLSEFLDSQRNAYYDALRDADRRLAAELAPEIHQVESLICSYLIEREVL